MFKGVVHLKIKTVIIYSASFCFKTLTQNKIFCKMFTLPFSIRQKQKAVIWLQITWTEHKSLPKNTGSNLLYLLIIWKRATWAFFKSSPFALQEKNKDIQVRAIVNYSFKSNMCPVPLPSGHKNPKCCQYSTQISWYETSGITSNSTM